MRYGREIGLKVPYSENIEVRKTINRLKALPLLLIEHIASAFHIINDDISDDDKLMKSLFKYFKKQWIIHPVFKIENLSVFGEDIRTNNDVEVYHLRLKHLASKDHIQLYPLIYFLYKEAETI